MPPRQAQEQAQQQPDQSILNEDNLSRLLKFVPADSWAVQFSFNKSDAVRAESAHTARRLRKGIFAGLHIIGSFNVFLHTSARYTFMQEALLVALLEHVCDL